MNGGMDMLIVLSFVFILICLSILSMVLNLDVLINGITAITAILGIFGVWIQLNRENQIKEAEFIMEYNNSFISNQELVAVEHLLELSRKGYDVEIINKDNLQSVINYLVYHEALSALVFRKVVSIKHIDDLFMYRFYLAMNNKEIQEKELCHEYQYYKGCYKLYKKWTEYRKEQGLEILLEENALDQTEAYQKVCHK